MATRKDLMRVLRRDADFSATIKFGASKDESEAERTDQREWQNQSGDPPLPPDATLNSVNRVAERTELPLPENPIGRRVSPSGTTRVYVAVSLTTAQAERAKAWAERAGCSVPFLIRRVCNGVRGEALELWSRQDIEPIGRSTVRRGRYPTSVTLTLPADLAGELSDRFDPTGLLGLARVIGPSFRERFDEHFDQAARIAGF